MKISVIIPVLNEAATIAACLAPLQPFRGERVEVIVVDGGSEDKTMSVADPLADRLIAGPAGRAVQMNAGWQAATGDLLWFLHADTRVSRANVEWLQTLTPDRRLWGRFDVRLDAPGAMYRVIETMMNLRSRLSGIATGDQAIFVHRELMCTIGGYQAIALMEDIALSRRLKRLATPVCSGRRVTTSARRWQTHGVWRTILLMWRLRLAYALGADPRRLAARYRNAR